jgi:glucoamylase
MPLVWAHAEFLKLLVARQHRRPLELLDAVEEHLSEKPTDRGTWHWRPDTPFDALPKQRELLIDLPMPFSLHVGFDGWQGVQDRKSTPLPLGRHGVRLKASDFAARGAVDFTLHYEGDGHWEGRDYRVRLPAT